MKEIKQEMKVEYNIDAFTLNNPSKKDIALLRLATRYKDSNIVETLKEKGVIKASDHKHNLIANAGKSVFALLLAGDNTYSGEITHGAVGTGETAKTASDTQLETEIFRTETSSSAVDGNRAYIDFFYDKGDFDEANIKEFGNFIDGEAGADTGQLFSTISVNWSKTSTESLFVACSYRFV
jgi:hypothetical protein